MATVIQSPDSLSLLRNVKHFILNTTQSVALKLMIGDVVIMDETYTPDADNRVDVDVMQVLSERLSISIPSSDSFEQTAGKATVTYYVDGAQISSFVVIAGGVRKLAETPANFCAANWMTWQPQTKAVGYDSPEFLTYYHQAAGTVKAMIYPKVGDPVTLTLYSGTAGKLMTYNVAMSHIFAQATGYDADDLYGLVDVWVENGSGTRLTYIQRYVFSPYHGDEHCFCCVNSLGGIDTFIFTGAQHLVPNFERESGTQGDSIVDISEDQSRRYSQHTGLVSRQMAAWLWDFFSSDHHWILTAAGMESIVLDASTMDISDEDVSSGCTFNFVLAEDGTLLNVDRVSNEGEPIEVESPDGELFFLPPRIADFPEAELDDSLLFLVQTPFYQSWRKLSLGEFKDWIYQIILPTSHVHENKAVLDQFHQNQGENVSYGDNEMAYISDVNKRLRRDIEDTAQGLINFLDGIKFGTYQAGMTGQGGYIDGQANAELESMRLRSFLEVPELRYNRVSVEIGNKWNAPGGGIIEKVDVDTDVAGNPLATGTITLHLEDGEIGTVAEDDICMGIYHHLTAADNADTTTDDSRGNFTFCGFATSYFRITEILDERCSKFRYVLRGISARWQSQIHPTAMMHFVGYGNFTNTARQTSRYSTRTYERYLGGVNDWEFTSGMIKAQFGDLSNLNIFGLQMSGYSAYLNNIYMSGTIQQFEELPLRIEIDTNGDNFLAYGETMTVTCRVWKGMYEDVTDQVTLWQIVRDSGDAAADAAWQNKTKVQEFAGSIVISFTAQDNDLSTVASVLSTLFTITAYINSQSAQAVITI